MNKAFIILTIIFLSFSCRSEQEQGEGFVSLAPAATEIIYKLGAEDKLKAVSDYCDWPQEVKEKASAGGLVNPSFEKIISLNPKVVFTLADIPLKIKSSLKKNGIKVIETESSGFKGIYSDIEKIARLTGKVEEGQVIISEMKEQIKKISSRSDASAKRVYAEISVNPAMSPGKKSHIHRMIQLVGGENVSGGENRDYVLSGVEYIISEKPDIILIISEPGEQRVDYLKDILEDSVPAAAEENIYYIENRDVILRPGPRVIEGIKKIDRYIHKDKINEK